MEALRLWLPALTPIVVLASIRVAWYGVSSQRELARKKASMDFITNREWSDSYPVNRAKFIELRDAADSHLASLATLENASNPESHLVRVQLNDHELMAIGIKERLLDEELLRKYLKSTVIRDFQECLPFINATRSRLQNPNIYLELEKLVGIWRKY